jgi:DNA-binding NarL/FixJ family response regulator
MTPAPLTIVVADDHPLFRAGIVRALEEAPGSSSSARRPTGRLRSG